MAGRVPDGEAAPEAEIEEAIRSLSLADHLRLMRFASWRMARVGRRAARGRTADDLIGEAVTATLDGRRRWRKGAVDFVRHLVEAMRSISSHWAEHEAKEVELPESALEREDEEGETWSPLAVAASEDPDPHDQLETKQEAERARTMVEAIEKLFENDEVALEILGGLAAGMTGPEVREAMALSENAYEAAMKRIRYKVRKRLGAEYDDE